VPVRHLCILFVALATPALAASALAQQQRAGQVADSVVGKAGQRQSVDESVEKGKLPVRIDTRIANRIESRLPSRIDRYSDQNAHKPSPTKSAFDRMRNAGSGRPRR
jgi:hypothetical protein